MRCLHLKCVFWCRPLPMRLDKQLASILRPEDLHWSSHRKLVPCEKRQASLSWDQVKDDWSVDSTNSYKAGNGRTGKNQMWVGRDIQIRFWKTIRSLDQERTSCRVVAVKTHLSPGHYDILHCHAKAAGRKEKNSSDFHSTLQPGKRFGHNMG